MRCNGSDTRLQAGVVLLGAQVHPAQQANGRTGGPFRPIVRFPVSVFRADPIAAGRDVPLDDVQPAVREGLDVAGDLDVGEHGAFQRHHLPAVDRGVTPLAGSIQPAAVFGVLSGDDVVDAQLSGGPQLRVLGHAVRFHQGTGRDPVAVHVFVAIAILLEQLAHVVLDDHVPHQVAEPVLDHLLVFALVVGIAGT